MTMKKKETIEVKATPTTCSGLPCLICGLGTVGCVGFYLRPGGKGGRGQFRL